MSCANCGTAVRDGDYFCANCAAEVVPTGIKLVCVFGVLSVLVGFFVGVGSLLAGGGIGVPSGVITIVFALALAYVLRGLWTLQRWAWGWALVLFGIDVLLTLRGAIAGSIAGVVSVLVSLLVFGYIYTKRDLYASQ